MDGMVDLLLAGLLLVLLTLGMSSGAHFVQVILHMCGIVLPR